MYKFMGVRHFKSEETGHWKASSIGLNPFGKGWKSRDEWFDSKGKHASGAYLDLNSIKPLA